MTFLLKHPRKVHGITPGCTYKPAPLDGSLVVSEIYDFHYRENPDHPVFVYANPSGGLTHLPYSKVVPAAHRAARNVAKMMSLNLEVNDSVHPRPLVAIVAATDTITYFCTLVGLLRAEIPIFPISNRNQPAAIAHLISKTRPTLVLISAEAAIRDNVQTALNEVQNPPPLRQMPLFEEIFLDEDQVKFIPLPPRRRDLKATRLLVHTSGSTSFPKPIIWNDETQLQVAMVPGFGSHDLCGQVVGCHAISMFHAIGLNLIAWLSATGLIAATFAPSSPAQQVTPDSVYQGFVATSINYAFGVPAFLDTWSKDPEKIAFFKSIKGLAYGGGILDKSIGDQLAKEGVAIYTFYGATEVGVIAVIFPEPLGMNWDHIVFNPHCGAELVPMGDGTFELIVVAGETQALTITNSKFQGKDAYATSDLLTPHPLKPGLWRVVGRRDDILVLSTGEKTNPVPIEAIVLRHPDVFNSVVFGKSRFHNGILIQPTEQAVFDSEDKNKLEEFRDRIWPLIEEANRVSPSHSRLFKEMILVAKSSKPFSYTPKGAPRRTKIYADYDAEINAAYDAFNQVDHIEEPLSWNDATSLSFLRKTVHNVLKRAIGDKENIFDNGCDSLQAMWIKNALVQAIKNASSHPISIPDSNFVYQHPDITSLASFVLSTITTGFQNRSVVSAVETLSKATAHYLDDLTTRQPAFSGEANIEGLSDVILLTGGTGALGSAVLAKLVSSKSVSRIYVLNRPARSGGDIEKRQQAALKERGYDPELVLSPKVVLLEGRLDESGLGINSSYETQIRRTLTHIVHIAWPIDFNKSLSSFDQSLGGLRTLVKLALSSTRRTPRLLFCSTVGIFRNFTSLESVAENPLTDPRVPLGQGYSEAKWISEQILLETAGKTELRPVIVRIGQISGATNGAWNATDWLPVLVKSSIALGSFPALKGTCTWIPLDLASQALVEMRNSGSPIVHLVHPNPISADQMSQSMSQVLNLPLRPYAEWLEALEKVNATANSAQSFAEGHTIAETIPAIKLIDFFRDAADANEDGSLNKCDVMGIPVLDMKEARKAASILSDPEASRCITAGEVRGWVKYWVHSGFLPNVMGI